MLTTADRLSYPWEESTPMTSSPTTMRAVRLSAPGPVDYLRLTTLALPPERDGWVRIRVEAFGLNRSELKLRLGLSVGVSFPEPRRVAASLLAGLASLQCRVSWAPMSSRTGVP